MRGPIDNSRIPVIPEHGENASGFELFTDSVIDNHGYRIKTVYPSGKPKLDLVDRLVSARAIAKTQLARGWACRWDE